MAFKMPCDRVGSDGGQAVADIRLIRLPNYCVIQLSRLSGLMVIPGLRLLEQVNAMH